MKRLLMLLLALMLCVPGAWAETGGETWWNVLGRSGVQTENVVRYVDAASSDRVHLRSAPSRSSESLGLYYTGTPVQTFHQNGDWTFVVIGAAEGWMMSGYLSPYDVAQLGPWQVVDNHRGTWVNLRAAPTTQGGILTCPDNGSAVHILGETADGWSYVEFAGVKGYMVTDYLSPMEDAEAFRRTTILGTTGDWDCIHRYTAPNGQDLYFAAVEEAPPITFRDVNFDGVTDIVVFVSMGASNFYTEFFVYDTEAGEYARAEHRGIDYGLCNYQLYPEYGVVESHAANGYAGALHEICLFRWEGTDLKLIRRAVSTELTETVFGTDSYTTTTYNDVLHIRVSDYQSDEYRNGTGTIIWEKTVSLDDYYGDVMDREQEALWQGVR